MTALVLSSRVSSCRPARIGFLAAFTLTLLSMGARPSAGLAQERMADEPMIPLPEVSRDGTVSLERTIAHRRSVREFTTDPLAVQELAQLLWAGQGITDPQQTPPPGFAWEWQGGLRTAPSAGALYPLELYAVVGNVEGLQAGVYRYVPQGHGLVRITGEDLREPLWEEALRQPAVRTAPLTLVIAGVVERTAAKYGDRAQRYVHMEVGAAAQNIYLQAETLELGTVFMGAFRDEGVREVLGLPAHHRIYGIMPAGSPLRTPEGMSRPT